MNLPTQTKLNTSEQAIPPTHLALYRRLATVFIVMTLAVAALVFYVVWSRATVIVLSLQEEIRTEFIADIAQDPSGGELAGAVLEKTESLSRIFPTATISKAETHAEGRVKITSSLASPQTLVATTRLMTEDDVLFRIKDQVIVPAYGSIEVDVFSDGIGEANDIGDATFVIPGLNPVLRKKFDVETVTPISGGVEDIRMVTKADMETAVAQLKEELSKTIESDLRQKALATGAPISGEVIEFVLLHKESDPEVGTKADEFEVSIRLRADGVFFDQVELDRLSEARVKEIVPFGSRLLGLADGATEISVDKNDLTSGRAHLRVSVMGNAVLSEDSPALSPSKVAGVTSEAAISYLEQVTGVASASVKISPFWSNHLPTVADNIKVEVR